MKKPVISIQTEKLASSFMEMFGLREINVTINKPLAGGYITRLKVMNARLRGVIKLFFES